MPAWRTADGAAGAGRARAPAQRLGSLAPPGVRSFALARAGVRRSERLANAMAPPPGYNAASIWHKDFPPRELIDNTTDPESGDIVEWRKRGKVRCSVRNDTVIRSFAL